MRTGERVEEEEEGKYNNCMYERRKDGDNDAEDVNATDDCDYYENVLK